MKYYISDLHFGHKNAIKFDNRPFSDVNEMNDTLVSNWNSAVARNDDVYVLGDFFWNNNIIDEILPRLKGNIHLVIGNHDRINTAMKNRLASIESYKHIKDRTRNVILCHFPIAHWDGADYGNIHLYGHIHAGRDTEFFDDYKRTMQQRDLPYKCYNVGCMLPYMNYTPRTLDEIIAANNNR